MKALLLSMVGLAGLSVSAMAADLVEPIYQEVPEIVPVEIGSGWYLRGDVSYDFKSDFDGSYDTNGGCPGGCGPASYSTNDYDDWSIDDGANVGLGLGYQFTDYFRGDLTAHYWSADVHGRNASDACGTNCYSTEEGKVTAWELMANAYVDLGTFAGFTPYVGGGVGGVHLSYDDFASNNYGVGGFTDSDTLAGVDSWRFAYALMAGVSYDLTQALKLDVGYRYLNIDDGEMFGANAAGGVVGGSDNGFDRHTIQAGLRYSLF